MRQVDFRIESLLVISTYFDPAPSAMGQTQNFTWYDRFVRSQNIPFLILSFKMFILLTLKPIQISFHMKIKTVTHFPTKKQKIYFRV